MSDKNTNLLQKLQSGEITLEECQSQLNQKQKVESQIYYKVSPKGCISFYGIRRMPISLYRQELEMILDTILEGDEPSYNGDFSEFLKENDEKLSSKK